MSQSRTKQMVDRLREMQASSPDIEASAIVSVDGLSIASALPQDIEGEEAVLTALASEKAKLGLIFLDMRRAVEDLEKLI